MGDANTTFGRVRKGDAAIVGARHAVPAAPDSPIGWSLAFEWQFSRRFFRPNHGLKSGETGNLERAIKSQRLGRFPEVTARPVQLIRAAIRLCQRIPVSVFTSFSAVSRPLLYDWKLAAIEELVRTMGSWGTVEKSLRRKRRVAKAH